MDDIKRQIKELQKLKKDLRPGTKERIEIYRKIKALKQQQEQEKLKDKDKEPIIKEILKYEPSLDKILNLYAYSVEQLALHLQKVKAKQS